jgi:hypothetical protein
LHDEEEPAFDNDSGEVAEVATMSRLDMPQSPYVQQHELSMTVMLTKPISDDEMEWLLYKYLSSRVRHPITRSKLMMAQLQKFIVAERI